jgi:hypothetical protein
VIYQFSDTKEKNMSKLDEFNLKKSHVYFADAWSYMIGKRYDGGGGGTGRLHGVKFQKVELYYQALDGAKNYHQPPDSFIPYLEKSTEILFTQILELALGLQKEDLRLAALAALKENETIIEELKGFENA